MELDEAIVFETDRFDAASKTMDPVGDPRWFNIGCAGHTLAKMHLTRNTIASGAAAHGVSANDRQATLKMLVADYCGILEQPDLTAQHQASNLRAAEAAAKPHESPAALHAPARAATRAAGHGR